MCCRVPWCRLVLQRLPATAVFLTEFSGYSSERSRKFSNCRKQRNKQNYQKLGKTQKKTQNYKKKQHAQKKKKKNAHTQTSQKKTQLRDSWKARQFFSESPDFFYFWYFFVFLCVFLYFRFLMWFNMYFYCFLMFLCFLLIAYGLGVFSKKMAKNT